MASQGFQVFPLMKRGQGLLQAPPLVLGRFRAGRDPLPSIDEALEAGGHVGDGGLVRDLALEPAPRGVVEDRAADRKALHLRLLGGSSEGCLQLVLRRLEPEQHDAAAKGVVPGDHVSDGMPGRFVPLRLELDLCIKPDYLRAHVLAAVREAVLRLFQPDNTTFGEAVYISRIVAAVMAVDGVLEVDVKRLERLADVAKGVAPESGILKLKPFEIARLDNDPAIPENGILAFGNVRGGR